MLSTRVEEHSDSDGSTYEPVVVWYRVNDREYPAGRVTPLNESRKRTTVAAGSAADHPPITST